MIKTKTQDYRKIIYFILISAFLFAPLFVFGQPTCAEGGPCGLTYRCFQGNRYGECNWNDLVAAVTNLINKVIPIVLGFSVVIIAWAGFRYMISGDNASERTKANQMLMKVGIGIFFIMAAWLIVNIISTTLLSGSVPRIIENPN